MRPIPLTFALVLYVGVGRCVKTPEGLKFYQAETKCQMPENTLRALPKKRFVLLNDVILSSCQSVEDKIYYQTSIETIIPVSNVRKQVASKNCFLKTTDIVINPISEYLNNDISRCGKSLVKHVIRLSVTSHSKVI